MASEHYQAIVIGAGQGGDPLARALAGAGWRTALIEREHVGGTCVNVGCTPTKTMVASARVAYLARRAADYGVNTGPISIDMMKVRERKRAIVNDFRASTEHHIKEIDCLDLIYGEGSFTGPNAIAVLLPDGGARQLTADKIILNTGARPSIPAIPGIENINFLNSTSIMELNSVPERLLVLGGGYVGLEFAQMFCRFGSKVTVVQRSGTLLSREDSDVAEEVAKILREDDIEILLNTSAVSVANTEDRGVRLTVNNGETAQVLEGSHLLAAVGRTPNTDTLNAQAAGIKLDDRGNIAANEFLETSAPNIYAMGDVKGGPAFTHISYDDYRVLRANLLEGSRVSIEGRLVPNTVFIDPQLGRVGMSETEARARGLKFQIAKMPMTYVARAIETAETRGFMKAVVDTETKQILGCAVLGLEGGEIMAAIQIAIMGKLPYTALQNGIFAHPTLAESLNNLFANMSA